MTYRILAALLLSLCLSSALEAAAKKGYITDKLEVQMRSGQSLQHRMIKMLPSGTPVSILSENAESGYSLVRLENGEDGWVLSRYVTTEPLARIQLDDTNRKLQTIQEENQRLKNELAALKAGKEGADQTAQQRQSEVERLNTEVIAIRQASANALQIQEERDRLQQYVINLERDVEALRRDKGALEGDYRQNWFLIGAGVLFGGIALGLVLPRISLRKKASWDSF